LPRRASVVLRAIREEIFGYSQKGFAETLGYNRKETICRLESGKPDFPLNSSHLDKLRRLAPHPDKAEAFEALLNEFQAALSADDPAEKARIEAQRQLEEGIGQAKEAARQAEDAAQRSAEFHERVEACRAEEAQRAEQLRQADEDRRAEEAQRLEQLRQADEDRRAEEARDRAEALRQMNEEVRQVKGAAGEASDAARVAKQSAEVAQQVTTAAMKRLRRSRYVMAALALVVSPIFSITAVRYTETRTKRETDTLAREEKAQPAPPRAEEPPQTDPGEEADTAGLDGGTALAEALVKALPFPPHGVPGQKAAPCASGEEEFSGYCYAKYQLTANNVSRGHCESLRLYEPSPGWCRAHRLGYLPVYTGRKDNNAVEPQ